MIWNTVKQFINPTYTPPTVQVYERREIVPQVQKEAKKDNKDVFVGRNSEGAVITTRRFEWNLDGSTEFAPVTAQVKGRKIGEVEPNLTAADQRELSKRKLKLSITAAQTLKRCYAESGGTATGKELALQTGYSLAYGELALACFKAALLE